MPHNIEVLSYAKCIIGEGPLWDSRRRELNMVDIQGRRVRKIQWGTLHTTDIVYNQEIGFLILGESGKLYAGCEDGIYLINENSDMTKVSKIKEGSMLKGARFNDGKVGINGKLYCGTFSRDNSAAFYRMEEDGTLTELFDKVGNSNGLDFDTELNIMYYNDTPLKRTDAFTISGDEIIKRRTVIEYPSGHPDGMTIDTDGNLWTALWGTGKVVKVNPKTGKIIDEIVLPVSQPSCCAFCGDDLKTLVITSAAHGVQLRDEPLAGSTFAVELTVGGKDNFKLKNF